MIREKTRVIWIVNNSRILQAFKKKQSVKAEKFENQLDQEWEVEILKVENEKTKKQESKFRFIPIFDREV